MELGSALAKLRNAKGLTQREFAQEIGVSNGAVAHICFTFGQPKVGVDM